LRSLFQYDGVCHLSTIVNASVSVVALASASAGFWEILFPLSSRIVCMPSFLGIFMSTRSSSPIMAVFSGVTFSFFRVCLCIFGLDFSHFASQPVVIVSKCCFMGAMVGWNVKWAMVVTMAVFKFNCLAFLTAGAASGKRM